MNDLVEHLANFIEEKIKEAALTDIWMRKGKLNRIKDLSLDGRGDIGKDFIKMLVVELKYNVSQITTNDPKKRCSLTVNGQVKLEVRMATIGKGGDSFQHEHIEKDKDYDALVLLDIAPNNLYLTVAPKETLPFEHPNDNWTATPRKMFDRKDNIFYKWDFTSDDVKNREIKSLEDVKTIFGNVLPDIE